MATLTFKAVAPAIPTPIQWGSNVFPVGTFRSGHIIGRGDESIPPNPPLYYTVTVHDFIADTMPPFEARAGKKFHSIKIVDLGIFYNHGRLILNEQLVQVGQVITIDDIVNRRFKIHSLGQVTTLANISKFKILYSDDGINYSPETLTEITVVYSRRDGVAGIKFKENAELIIDSPNMIVTAEKFVNIFEYEPLYSMYEQNQMTDLAMYINSVNGKYPAKIEFRDLDDFRGFTHYGKEIRSGQRIQIQAFSEGRVRVNKDAIVKDHKIEILFGETLSGRFRLTELLPN